MVENYFNRINERKNKTRRRENVRLVAFPIEEPTAVDGTVFAPPPAQNLIIE